MGKNAAICFVAKTLKIFISSDLVIPLPGIYARATEKQYTYKEII